MRGTAILRAQQARKPMIKFLGKRNHTKPVDHTPQPHPASPTHSLPETFVSYRSRAQQHGPMGGNSNTPSPAPASSSAAPSAPKVSAPRVTYGGRIGSTPARRLGSIKPQDGEYFDRSELPRRFQKLQVEEDEMEAITSGGASMWR